MLQLGFKLVGFKLSPQCRRKAATLGPSAILWARIEKTSTLGYAAQYKHPVLSTFCTLLPWIRLRVKPLTKQIAGPVHIFARNVEKAGDLENLFRSLRRIRIEAHGKYHFSNGKHIPFECPEPHCSQKFEAIEEYTQHLVRQKPHDGWDGKVFMKAAGFPSSLPTELEE
jgi:hypothetical protein